MDLPDGNWTFHLTAPNGGVAAVGTTLESQTNVFQVGFECEYSRPSNFTLCKEVSHVLNMKGIKSLNHCLYFSIVKASLYATKTALM